MNQHEIAPARMASQNISAPQCAGIQQLAGWMGAMQAQDYTMAKWAIGSRLPGTCETAIEEAITSAQIIRTHVLRPTWHFVSATDIYWMLALSAPQIRAATRSRDASLGLTEEIIARGTALLEKILDGGKQLTRSAIAALFAQQGLQTDENRLYHFLMRAEIDGIIFSRHSGTSKQTYSLLRDSIPLAHVYPREESAAMLASRYIASHGPATAHDFAWWSGLSVSESRQALQNISPSIVSETIGGITYHFSPASLIPVPATDQVHLLAAFDEYIISYKDRTAAIALQHQPRAFTSNGIFKPIIVSGSQVIGTWKLIAPKDRLIVETALFPEFGSVSPDQIAQAAARLGNYYQKQIELQCIR